MAQETRTQLKTYFQTGDTPTQAEFINLIDSQQNITDDGVSATVDGTETLTNKTLTSPVVNSPTGIVTNDVTESTDKNYVTDAEAVVIGNTSGTNTGDDPGYEPGGTDVAVADGGTGASTASGARTNLDVDQAGTDNSTDVTLTGTPDYITITGQAITRNAIDLTTDVTGELPTANVANTSGTNTGDDPADDTAYDETSWNNNTDSATKNAIRDKIEIMDSAIGLNTAKETNATHSGEVTGSGALTVADNVIDEANLKLDEAPTNDHVLTADSSKSGGMKWAASSAGFSDPMTTRGDIIYKNSSNVTTRLPVGTNGQALMSDGTDVAWATPAGSGNVSTSGTPVDNDFAKFVDGTDIEGRSYAEVRSDLNVADGATANSADATLLARANHTGTQAASTISDFDVEVANNSAVSLNTAKDTNVSTNLSEGTSTTTTVDVNSSDGTNATLVSASTTRAGLLTKAKWDEIVANTAKDTNVPTELSIGTKTGTTVAITSDGGADDVTLPASTTDDAGLMTATQYDKLDGIEAGADVTDTTNVTAAGALMDSEVDADIKTLALPASTTISTFGKSLVDDADAGTARTTLDVDQAGTDNSTDVTLDGTPNYITISGQTITRSQIDLTTDVTGNLPTSNVADLSGSNTGDEPDANLTTKGIVELATTAETTTGTDATRAVTPDGLKDGYQGSTNVTTLGTIGTGTWQGTAINQTYLTGQSGTNTGDEPTATTSVSGISELATTTETSTGTATNRVVTPDGLSGSIYGRKTVIVKTFADDTAVATGNGKAYFTVPDDMDGMNLVDADASVYTTSSSGTPTVQIYNLTQTQDMLSTRITIDTTEYNSYTAATQPVINTSNDDVDTGDRLRIDVDVAGTGTKGLDVILVFATP